jgi:hypothetical protein
MNHEVLVKVVSPADSPEPSHTETDGVVLILRWEPVQVLVKEQKSRCARKFSGSDDATVRKLLQTFHISGWRDGNRASHNVARKVQSPESVRADQDAVRRPKGNAKEEARSYRLLRDDLRDNLAVTPENFKAAL